MNIGMVIALIKKLGVTPDPSVIESAVNDYMEEHPEATAPIDDTAGEGDTGKLWSADKTAGEVATLTEAIEKINEEVYDFDPMTASVTAVGWRLNESNGLCSSDASYKLVKYQVTAGDVIHIVSDDRFQFQTIASVPSSGNSNRVGDTYGTGTFDLTVPETATYLIFSTPVSNSGMSASVKESYGFETMREEINKVQNDVELIIESGEVEEPTTRSVDFTGSENGYINSSGSLVGTTGSTFVHTKPFELKAGDRIDIRVRGYYQGSTILSILAKVLQSGYESLVSSADAAEVRDYTYTAQSDMTCVISYRAANDHTATITGMAAVDISQNIVHRPHYVKHDGNSVFVKSFYSDTEDIVVEITKAGGNNLPNPKNIFTVEKDGDIMTDSLTPSRYLLNRYTDWFSPHQVRAVNNADGSEPTTVIFTGGNHQSNNQSSGGVATAENTMFEVLCDGVKLADGEERFCFSVAVNITNEICGYNTWKSDGTGRKILKEQIRIAMGESARMDCEIIHTAEEDIQRMRYYGLQAVLDSYTTGIQYLGGTNRALNTLAESSNSGNNTCRNGRMISPAGDILLTHIDDVDLGSFAYNSASDGSCFATASAKKSYYALISNDGTAQNIFDQDDGEITCARGWYDWVFSPSDVTQ